MSFRTWRNRLCYARGMKTRKQNEFALSIFTVILLLHNNKGRRISHATRAAARASPAKKTRLDCVDRLMVVGVGAENCPAQVCLGEKPGDPLVALACFGRLLSTEAVADSWRRRGRRGLGFARFG